MQQFSKATHLIAIIGDKLLLLYLTVRQSSRNEIHRKAHTEVFNNESRSLELSLSAKASIGLHVGYMDLVLLHPTFPTFPSGEPS